MNTACDWCGEVYSGTEMFRCDDCHWVYCKACLVRCADAMAVMVSNEKANREEMELLFSLNLCAGCRALTMELRPAYDKKDLTQMRTTEEILAMEEEYVEKLWYSRHREFHTADMRKSTYDPGKWKEAFAQADVIEKKFPKRELPPWDDFEHGMVCGKLSALWWVLGHHRDKLDT